MDFISNDKKYANGETIQDTLTTIVERVNPVRPEKMDIALMSKSMVETEDGQAYDPLVELLTIVERENPMNLEKTDIPPISIPLVEVKGGQELATQSKLVTIVERVKPKISEETPPNGSFSRENELQFISTACSDEVQATQRKQATVLNFAEIASISAQVPQNPEIFKVPQPRLPIIQANYKDEVKEKRIPPAMIVARQLAKYHRFGIYNDDFYVFETNHYKLCNNKALEKIIYSAIEQSGITLSGYRVLQDIREFLKLEIMSKIFTIDDVDKTRRYIGFKNGYLHLDTLEFMAPNPSIFLTNYLEVEYSPHILTKITNGDLKQIQCSNFDKFINSLAGGNPQIFDRIYEVIGYILSNDCAAKKLFVLSGVKDSGKSKLGKFIINLFNAGAAISIPIGELGERFSVGDLPGKSLCVDLDLPATKINAKTAAKIKSLTGGDATSSESKFESRRTFVSIAKLLFATNHPIVISEKEYVLRDRFLCIPIMKSVPKDEQCPNLLDYFEAEKLLIVMKSIGYYRQLVRNNYKFTGEFDLNVAFIHTNSGVAMPMEDMIKRFVEERCLFASVEQWEFTDNLYNAFCGYYGITKKDQDYKNFSLIFSRVFSDKIQKTKKRRNNAQSPLSVFLGVILKDEPLISLGQQALRE